MESDWYQGKTEIASFEPEEIFGTKLRALLLPAGVRFNDDDAMQAFERVWRELITCIKGDAWKLTDKVLEELRAKKYPDLLRR